MNEKIFEKQQLDKLINDLKDINQYKSFKNGSFIYDLGKYQGNLLVNYIEKKDKEKHELIKYLKEEINECKTIANDEDYLKADIYQEILNKIEEIGVKND